MWLRSHIDVAVAMIQPPAWEFPYATGSTLKGKKKIFFNKKIKQGEENWSDLIKIKYLLHKIIYEKIKNEDRPPNPWNYQTK